MQNTDETEFEQELEKIKNLKVKLKLANNYVILIFLFCSAIKT